MFPFGTDIFTRSRNLTPNGHKIDCPIGPSRARRRDYAVFLRAAAVERVADRGRALWKFRNLRTCPHNLQTPRLLAPFEC
jgi:hypothetical protein